MQLPLLVWHSLICQSQQWSAAKRSIFAFCLRCMSAASCAQCPFNNHLIVFDCSLSSLHYSMQFFHSNFADNFCSCCLFSYFASFSKHLSCNTFKLFIVLPCPVLWTLSFDNLTHFNRNECKKKQRIFQILSGVQIVMFSNLFRNSVTNAFHNVYRYWKKYIDQIWDVFFALQVILAFGFAQEFV